MNHYYKRLFFSFLFFFISGVVFAQNTSNKGTDFWIGYTGHLDGTTSQMNLYITSDVNTSGTVSIPLQGWSTPFTVTANNTTIIAVPSVTAYVGCSGCIQDRGIHVVADLPIVVYSHIYSKNRSDATLVLPVPTLGKEYYTMGYTQTNLAGGIFGGGTTGYAEFMVVAVEDNTEVQITPTQATLDGQPANVPFTVTLNQGEVYQVQSATDLTGSHVMTTSSGTSACKRIAMFAGSTWDIIGCPGGSTGDNLYQQLYPVNAWGNNFVTVPFKTRIGGDELRILAGSDSTIVTINGGTPFLLNTAQFHDTLISTPNYITASKPITLAQYQRTQNCDNVTGDPSMTILNPVEQTLDTIALYSTTNYQITGEYINVIIKSNDTSAFRLDGSHVPFSVVPSNPVYSYSENTVSPGNHVLTSDSGFNAIAYGFGNVESYGYSAGANVKNLLQYVSAGSNGISNPHILCNGSTVNFNGVVSYTPASRKWYFGDGDTSLSANPTHTYLNKGTYTVSFVTVRGNGSSCDIKDSSTYTINIVGFPAPSFSFTNTCSNDSVHFTDNSQGNGGTIISRKWYFGDGDSSILQNPLHHYPSDATYTVTLIVKSSGGCQDTVKNPVVIAPLPIVNAGPDQITCSGSSVTLSTVTGAGYTYQWTGVGIACSTCSTTSAMPIDSGAYIIQTSVGACSAYDTVVVNVFAKAVAHILNDTATMCTSSSVVISTATQPNQTYVWSPATGLSCSSCSTTNASPAKTTRYYVTASFNSCQATDSILVQVLQPGAGPKPDTSICSTGSAVLEAFPAGNGFTYQWTPSTGLSCPTCQSTTATPTLFPTTYYVFISSNTCEHNDSVVIKQVTVAANAGTDVSVCAGKSVTLSASGGVDYKWSPSQGLSVTTGSTPTASPTVNTTYTVIVTDAKGCTGEDSVSVTFNQAFPATAGPNSKVCPGDSVHLISTGGVSYSWKPGVSLSDSTIANPVATITAGTTYTVSITGINGCVEERNVNIETFIPPLVFAGPDTVICENQPLKLSAFGASAYQWSGGGILGCDTCTTINVSTANNGSFTVIGTDVDGCKNTAMVDVVLSVYCHFILMPDAFSPNGDGHNDYFRPVGKGIVKVEYSIFNRWGTKVFTGTDLLTGWDGKYNDVLQPVGTYVWVLTASLDDGSTVKQHGNVTLVR